MSGQAEFLILYLQILGYLPLQMSFFGIDKFLFVMWGRLGLPSLLISVMVSFKGEKYYSIKVSSTNLLQLVKGTHGCQRLTCTTFITFGGY